MQKNILFTLTLLLLSACGSEPVQNKKADTLLDQKIDTLKEAGKNVEVLNSKTQETNALTASMAEAPSGSSLYSNKCASCHGKDAKKSALNASAEIAGWDSNKIQKTLKAYKDGSYGGKMKAIMQGQSKPLNDEEIKLIADYVSVL